MSEFKLNDFVKMTPEFLLFVKNKQEEVNKDPLLGYTSSHYSYTLLYKHIYDLGKVIRINVDARTLSVQWRYSNNPFVGAITFDLKFSDVKLSNTKAFK